MHPKLKFESIKTLFTFPPRKTPSPSPKAPIIKLTSPTSPAAENIALPASNDNNISITSTHCRSDSLSSQDFARACGILIIPEDDEITPDSAYCPYATYSGSSSRERSSSASSQGVSSTSTAFSLLSVTSSGAENSDLYPSRARRCSVMDIDWGVPTCKSPALNENDPITEVKGRFVITRKPTPPKKRRFSVASSPGAELDRQLPPIYRWHGAYFHIRFSKVDQISTNRLQEERKRWRKDHPFGFYAKPVSNPDGTLNLHKWKAGIPGKAGTLWEGGLYTLEIDFSKGYPSRPPLVKFVPAIFHPNVYHHGEICLVRNPIYPKSIIGDSWKPAISVKQILLGVQELLDTPNSKSPANQDANRLFTIDRPAYDKRVQAEAKRFQIISE